LVDGCLARPFFARNVKDQIIGLDSNAQWHNEMKGVMMIGNYHKKMRDFDKTVKQAEEDKESDIGSSGSESSDEELEEEEFMAEYRREMNNRAKASKKETGRRIGSNSYKMSFEIEYEYFESHFWNTIILKRFPYLDIHPLVVWSEIQSNIKGSANSHLYPGSYLPERVYFGKDSQKKNFLTKEKKIIIYDIFGRYERWKRDIAAYDFMDVVNYALAQIRFYGYNGAPIHYLMIDEVQDLTHATILLFMRTTTMGLFFSGDTAQTIAKGVGMRFSDLRSLFKIKEEMYYNSYYQNTWKEPVVKQLTVKYSSLFLEINDFFFRLTLDLMERSWNWQILSLQLLKLSSQRLLINLERKRVRLMVLSQFSSLMFLSMLYSLFYSVLKITRVKDILIIREALLLIKLNLVATKLLSSEIKKVKINFLLCLSMLWFSLFMKLK